MPVEDSRAVLQHVQDLEDDERCRNSDVAVDSYGADDGQEDQEDASEAEAELSLREEPLPAGQATWRSY